MSFKVENVSKKFGEQQVINNFSMLMNSGEISIILGESGSGKTTLLRMINNLETVDAGSISVDDNYLVRDGIYQDKLTVKKYQQRLGLVFQDYQLFPNLTVLENLLLAPLSNKFDDEVNLEVKAKNLLKQMGVKGKEAVKPGQLSGGQKQRVAIARAMMMNPSLLCFDEPTSALDDKSVAKVADLIRELAGLGMMILVITHDNVLVEQLGEAQVIRSDKFL